MNSLFMQNRLKMAMPFVFFMFFVFSPALTFSAGFQEKKMFDGDFYSSDELRRKIENHNIEIKAVNDQIKALETDIDWLVLKINEIQDSGRIADINLKKSITSKEKIVNTLQKSKNRLGYLVQYYTTQLDPKPEQTLKKILKDRLSISNSKKTDVLEESIVPQKIVSQSKVKSMPVQTVKDYNEEESISESQLLTAINNAGLSDWIEIIGSDDCMKIQTTLPILFPTGSAKVANEYKSFFQKLALFLKSYDVKILVNGYADSVPINNKKYPSNFELGAARAANIVHQLVNHGLKPSIFQIESTGKYRFAAKGMSKQKTLERRAEVTVIFQDK